MLTVSTKSKRPSLWALRCALQSTSVRTPCGARASTHRERSTNCSARPSSPDSTTVSVAGTATAVAPRSMTERMQRVMLSSSTRGRTPSWTRTIASSSPGWLERMTSRALQIDSWPFAPPGTMRTGTG